MRNAKSTGNFIMNTLQKGYPVCYNINQIIIIIQNRENFLNEQFFNTGPCSSPRGTILRSYQEF